GGGDARRSSPRSTEDKAGAYGLTGFDVMDAIDRGEGRQALAAYEQLASEAETRGALSLAMRAHAAVAMMARRLGQLQKELRAGLRAMEIGRQLALTSSVEVGAYADAALSVGRVYRVAGDRAEARRVLEDGVSF